MPSRQAGQRLRLLFEASKKTKSHQYVLLAGACR